MSQTSWSRTATAPMVLDILSSPQPGHDDRCSMATLHASSRFRRGAAIRGRRPGGSRAAWRRHGEAARLARRSMAPAGSGSVPRDGAERRSHREAVISGNLQASWAYAENFVAEDEVLATARAKAAELGCVPVLPGRRRDAAAARGRRRPPAPWSRSGPAPVSARSTCSAACAPTACSPRSTWSPSTIAPPARPSPRPASPSNRVRLISGRALDVLPRLTDAAYDLVFCDADKKEYAGYLEQALRLLKPGRAGRVRQRPLARQGGRPDPARRGRRPRSASWARTVRDDERLVQRDDRQSATACSPPSSSPTDVPPRSAPYRPQQLMIDRRTHVALGVTR